MIGSTGLLFDIKHYAIHDGPGIRTTVFFKGCPLNCKRCHSPESQSFQKEIMMNPELCISCEACIRSCPTGAIEQPVTIDHDKCNLCGRCVDECFSGALEMVGKHFTVEEVLREVEKDRTLYEVSGGGVTISGGEPTAQPEYLIQLLRALKGGGFHTALETCGHAPRETFEKIESNVDLFLYDVKHLDPEIHRELTGHDNDLIISNLRRLDRMGHGVIRVRVPLIPGYNDSEENLEKMIQFFGDLRNVGVVELLPYHVFGVPKYESLRRGYTLNHVRPYERRRLVEIRDRLRGHGLNVVLEGVD